MCTRQQTIKTRGASGTLTTEIAFFRIAMEWLKRERPTPEPVTLVVVPVSRAAKAPLNGCRIK